MIPITKQIKFNEPLHKYTDEDNNVYTSVTTLIQKYYAKFDEDFWAAKKAQELGISSGLVKQSWKNIREAACDRGNKIHKELEDSINESNRGAKFYFDDVVPAGFKGITSFTKTSIHLLAETPLAKKYPSIFEYLKLYLEAGWILYAEQRVYWYEYLTAGTIDCPLLNPVNKEFVIVDWKSNKDELKFVSGYYKKVNGIKTDTWVDKKVYMFNPINHLEECKGNIYTMQLSLYAYLLELWGYKCRGLVLFHIRRIGTEEQVQPPIRITYRQSEARNLLNHFKTNSNNSNTNNEIPLGIF